MEHPPLCALHYVYRWRFLPSIVGREYSGHHNLATRQISLTVWWVSDKGLGSCPIALSLQLDLKGSLLFTEVYIVPCFPI